MVLARLLCLDLGTVLQEGCEVETISKRTQSKKQDLWGNIDGNGSVQAKERKNEGKDASNLKMHKRRVHRGKNKLLFHVLRAQRKHEWP